MAERPWGFESLQAHQHFSVLVWSESGAIAQLGERYNGIVEVRSSILLGSTIMKPATLMGCWLFPFCGFFVFGPTSTRLKRVIWKIGASERPTDLVVLEAISQLRTISDRLRSIFCHRVRSHDRGRRSSVMLLMRPFDRPAKGLSPDGVRPHQPTSTKGCSPALAFPSMDTASDRTKRRGCSTMSSLIFGPCGPSW